MNCSINVLTPSLGPYRQQLPVKVKLLFANLSENARNITFAKFGYDQFVKLDFLNCTPVRPGISIDREQDDDYDSPNYISNDYATDCIYETMLPATSTPSVQLFNVPNCSGSLPFQHYDEAHFQLALHPVNITEYGGNALYVSYTVNSFLQTTNYSVIRLKDSQSTEYVDYDLQYGPNCLTESLINYRLKYIGTRIDESISNFTNIETSIAFDGAHFVPLTTSTPRRRGPFSLLFIFSGSSENANWDYAQNTGILRTTQELTASLRSDFVSDMDLSLGIDSNRVNFTQALSRRQYDVVFLLDPVLTDDLAYSYAAIAGELSSNKTQVICATHGKIDPESSIKNINFMWAHVYQARYMAGYLAGVMFKSKPSTKICYLKANNLNTSFLGI